MQPPIDRPAALSHSSTTNGVCTGIVGCKQLALDGLKAMGMQDRAAVFQRSLDYFGAKGPSSDRKTRQTQLSKIYRKLETDFNKLDSQYYDSKESVELGLTRFVIQNAPKFQ